MNTQIVSPTDWQALYHYTSLKGFERIVKSKRPLLDVPAAAIMEKM